MVLLNRLLDRKKVFTGHQLPMHLSGEKPLGKKVSGSTIAYFAACTLCTKISTRFLFRSSKKIISIWGLEACEKAKLPRLLVNSSSWTEFPLLCDCRMYFEPTIFYDNWSREKIDQLLLIVFRLEMVRNSETKRGNSGCKLERVECTEH